MQAVLLSATDKAIGLLDRFARCFVDGRDPTRTVYDVRTSVGQRVFGLCLGYEDLVDHDQLRHDPLLGALLGRLTKPPIWQEHAEPAGACAVRRAPLPQDQP